MDFVLNTTSTICSELKNLIAIIIARWSKYVEFWCNDSKFIISSFKWIVAAVAKETFCVSVRIKLSVEFYSWLCC